jgi:hypothetical protein
MSEEEKSRFEFCLRSHFNRKTIKNLMIDCLGKSENISDEVVICVAALAKLYVGDLVEGGELMLRLCSIVI